VNPVDDTRTAQTRSVRRIALLAIAGVMLLSGCELGLAGSGPRPEGGPFDAGQNGLPDAARVVEICGAPVERALRGVTDGYFTIAREWERFVVYADGIEENGVTVEEYTGAEQRHRNIERFVRDYRGAAENLRYSGARAGRERAADCDREVMIVFETIYQERETEIAYVTDESARRRETLRILAGVAS